MDDIQQADQVLSESLGEGWRLFSENPALFVLAGLAHLVLSVITLGLLLGPLTIGLIRLIQRRLAGEDVEVRDIFSGLSQFLPSAVAAFVMCLLISIGFAFLVLPGFVLMAGWMFTFHVMVRDDCGPWEAMATSWDLFRSRTSIVLVACVLLLIFSSLGSAVVLGTLLTTPLSLICLTILFGKLSSTEARIEGSSEA